MSRATILLLLLSGLFQLTGCIGTNSHRVRVRRDFVTVHKLHQKKDYAQRLREAEARAAKTRIPPELKRILKRDEITRNKLREILRSIPRDPWDSYETDRAKELYKKFADTHDDPPTIKELVELAIEQGDMKRPVLPKKDGEKKKKKGDDDDDDSGDDDDDDDDDDDE